ncbi:MAG: HPr family phosphocarrier protein [Rhodospirillales bacterium]
MPSRTVTIVNMRGLHARAAAKFAQMAGEYDADIQVSKDGQTVGGRSIMGLMMLAAAPGTEIHISCEGNACESALAALTELVEAGFDEELHEP